MKILNVEQMIEVDRLSTEEYSVPSILLMENAGIGLYRALVDYLGEGLGGRRVLIICGKGNNGGDGLVLARQLAMRGNPPDVWLLGRFEEVSGDAGINLAICKQAKWPIREISSPASWKEFAKDLDRYDVIIDAILGTGLSKPLKGLYSEVVSAINRASAFILSVDMPSGMFSDSLTGGVQTVCADVTVTFTAPKIAHILNEDQEAIGELKVVPIGSPPQLLEKSAYSLNLIEESDAAAFLPERRICSHKGDFGHVAFISGSVGKAGAAALCSWAALKTGSGLVTALVPQPIQTTVAASRAEIMTEGFDSTDHGTFSGRALNSLLSQLEKKDAVGMGPGLSTHPETVGVVREIVQKANLPMVLDADAVNAFAGRSKALLDRKHAVVALTPHPGEFSRLVGLSTAEVLKRRVELAREFAAQHRLWLVLKGFRTLVAEPDGQVYICPRGNPGMATAGMGDVLTGVLTSLLGQLASGGKLDPANVTGALAAGVYLHSLAGDLEAQGKGQAALAAGDVVESLAGAFLALGRLGE